MKNLLVLLIPVVIAYSNAQADLGVTPAKNAKDAKVFLTKAWKSPKLQVYAYHPSGDKLEGVIQVVGYSNNKSVVEIIYLTDKQIEEFPADKAYVANLYAFSGDLDWVQMPDSSSAEAEVWKIDGETAFILREQKALVFLDDEWQESISTEKLLEFTAEVTAWSNH